MTSPLRPSLCTVYLLSASVGMTVTHGAELARVEEYEPDPQYSFAYVHDPSTGDVKSQESKEGGEVRGSYTYSLVEPGGSLNTIRYTAGPLRGFHTDVTTHPVQQRPAVHQVHLPTTAIYTNVAALNPTTPQPGPAPGIRPAPVRITRPFLQYIGVRPSYRFAGAPYYQLQPVT